MACSLTRSTMELAHESRVLLLVRRGTATSRMLVWGILGALGLSLIGVLGIIGLVLYSFVPGGGGSREVAPSLVHPCEPTVVRLELSVWGGGGPIAGRYSDVRMYYQMPGEDGDHALAPKLVSRSDTTEVYEFIVPPLRAGTQATIDHYFEVTLDGERTRIPAKTNILVSGDCKGAIPNK
jgi:hypothetical protein